MQSKEPIAFSQNQREEVRELGDKAGAVPAEPGMHQQTFVAFDASDRRRGPTGISETTSPTVVAKSGTGGGNTPMVAYPKEKPVATCQNTGHGYWKESETGATLRTPVGGDAMKDNLIVEKDPVCIPINTHNNMRDPEKFDAVNRQGMGIGKDGDPAPTLSCNHVGAVAYDMRGNGDGNTIPTLTGDHASRPTDYTPVVITEQPIDFDTTQITSPQNGNNPQPGDPCHPLASQAHPPTIAIRTAHTAANGKGFAEESAYTLDAATAQGQAVATPEQRNISVDVYNGTEEKNDVAVSVTASSGGANHTGPKSLDTMTMAVRRLTPIECEYLQGFPRNFTQIPWKGKPAESCPDGPRYKSLGNSMAVPCLRFIGERIMAIEGL